MWLKVLAPAVCYLMFHWQFFRCVESILKIKPLPVWHIMWTYLLNFGLFFLCSIWNLHLILNWILFLFLLFAEQAFFYKQTARKCFLFALLGTQMGLAVNILFRSLIAAMWNMPLVAFDNNMTDMRNMKMIPVLLGFLAAGLVFFLIARHDWLKDLHLVLEDKRALIFLTCLLTAMHFYLCMNLMVYSIEENNLLIKLWSMKSSVIVLVGQALSIILSIRIGKISVYRRKSQASQELLAQERIRELQLRMIASTDPLTGCENRFQAKERIQGALEAERAFCLCFVDLNGLKAVNDEFGHEMGDHYLLEVAGALNAVCGKGNYLFRYGGDEFLLLLFDYTPVHAEALLGQVQDQLGKKEDRYPMSISYGIATREDAAEVAELIRIADARMYRMKTEQLI